MVFTEAMEQALATARETGESFGLLFVDLDGFKGVNDELGPPRRRRAALRGVPAAARQRPRATPWPAWAATSSAILLAGVKGTADADVAVERVLARFDEPFVVGGELLPLSASVGRALWPDDAVEMEALMRHADAEMYRAKRAARQRSLAT